MRLALDHCCGVSPAALGRTLGLLLACALGPVSPLAAQSAAQGGAEGIVVYEPDFFARYQPVTALDMVRQVPGFRLETRSPFGGQPEVRGFGAAAGNLLINGKRPSTKSDSMEDLLGRISAGEVLRLELIRGATGARDRDVTQGSVVLNVVLRDEQRSGRREPAPWELALHYEDEALSVLGELVYSLRSRRTRYLLGLKRNAYDWNLEGPEIFTSSTRPDELRDEIYFREGGELGLDLKTVTELSQGSLLRLNLRATAGENDELELSDRRLAGGGEEHFVRSNTSDEDELELAGDFERDLSARMGLKAIFLARRTREEGESGLEITRRDAGAESSRSPRSSESGESIARLELDWSGWSGHSVRFGAEAVHNFVDSTSQLFVDDGTGPVLVDVEGADTRVVERRAELFARDTWIAAERLTLDLGFAWEISEISQSGDVGNSRSFTYPKPSVVLAYTPSGTRQWRFGLERLVSQLDFFDFVSASNFEDLDLDFGNPDLRPERTWHLTATHERRFGDVGVVEVGLFYDRIDDVEDLLPVGRGFEIVGNIGPGERWGGSLDFTVPLSFLGLREARADVSYEIQRSSVTDPVTGLVRELSGESEEDLEVSLRKDLPGLRGAVGVDWNWSARPTSYGFDELDSSTRRSHLNVHFEMRMRRSAKLRFELFNLLDPPHQRRRTVFEESRLSGIVAFEENRSRGDGQWFRVTLSGLF